MNSTSANYRDVTENPCHMCMPMGAIVPFKGVEDAMVIIHGSQGCSTYMRRHMSEHYNEPVDVASSSITEKGTVYGGEANLKVGLNNLFKLYHPRLVGILTTCLAETIGEDVDRMALSYLQDKKRADFSLVTVPTPGYGGTANDGYFLASRRILAALVHKTPPHGSINIIVPHISPADIREIKRILDLMAVEYTLFPDYSDTLDAPFTRPYKRIPPGGTSMQDIAAMSGARATVQFGATVEEPLSPGQYLQEEFGVPLFNLPIPMGLRSTDTFLDLIKKLTGRQVPVELQRERGRLIDGMIDSHKYNARGRAVVFGEPEIIYAVVNILVENGICPVVAATMHNGAKFKSIIDAGIKDTLERAEIITRADFEAIKDAAGKARANIAIGPSEGKYLTEKAGIPLVRLGYPVHDRVGGQRLLSVGYSGSMGFLDRITNTLLEDLHSHYRLKLYNAYYHKEPGTLKGQAEVKTNDMYS